MKKSLYLFTLFIGVTACTQQVNYKTERDEVMKFHDIVMEDHTKLVNNQIKLDEMLKHLKVLKQQFPAIDTLKEKEAIKNVLTSLNHTEDLMNDWMHKFEPDVTGKSNEDAVKYFKGERVKIGRIDSIYKIEVKSSDVYLSKFKK
ncbi:hypothetical protein [Pedobacter sp. L105]|uniref:hypothetical protein n=1 Tax=Pedobacter sp. L105 TaxID=1641871 RepID=UPI00131D0885|nr:hypothetical protein [Pedobacter sp. L105]